MRLVRLGLVTLLARPRMDDRIEVRIDRPPGRTRRRQGGEDELGRAREGVPAKLSLLAIIFWDGEQLVGMAGTDGRANLPAGLG